jgi:Fe-S cluster assembly protein SufD
VFSQPLSSVNLPAGVEFFTTAQITSGEHEDLAALVGSTGGHRSAEFAALATALMSEVVCLRVKAGVVTQGPIYLLYVTTQESTGSVQVPRVLAVVGENANLSVVESFVSIGAERYLSIPIVEAFVAEGGYFDHVKIQAEHESASHMSHMTVEQRRSSTSSAHIFSFGGSLVRNSVDVELLGSGCHGVVNGLSLLVGDQHVDNTTNIHHVEPSSESRELFKGVYSDQSRGVFSGTIVVESEAQKTNAFQSNQSLLLSPNASIETRPQLKISADDVKCTHGATIGQLDNEALFYLRSRGIDQETARHFLVRAFVSEVLTTVKCEGTRQRVAELISAKLGAVA